MTTPQQHVVIAIAALGLLDEIADLKTQIGHSRDAERRADLESAIVKSAAQLHAFLPTEQPVPEVPLDVPVAPLMTPVVDPRLSFRPRHDGRGARPLHLDRVPARRVRPRGSSAESPNPAPGTN